MKKSIKKANVAKNSSSYSPHESPIIQAGVVLIIVCAIGITAYVFATYYR
jgi:hypothetical protein